MSSDSKSLSSKLLLNNNATFRPLKRSANVLADLFAAQPEKADSLPFRTSAHIAGMSASIRPVRKPEAISTLPQTWLGDRFLKSASFSDCQPLMAIATLMRLSSAAPIKERPPPYEIPAKPSLLVSGCHSLWLKTKEITSEMSRWSFGPAAPTRPPDNPKPLVAYSKTMYPCSAILAASMMYSNSDRAHEFIKNTTGNDSNVALRTGT
mmetsp:Transcript_21170/g.41360  ORF Transcript_21170/g.41360 Transcript_21170/m.41360 type:complete len:208 (+) Transcript_21170:1040-1663(+)